jgi:putative endonuclease
MFTVYVLFSKKFIKTYVGYTSDLEARILSHNSLATKGYTLKYRPWEVVHSEIFENKSDALKREKALKAGQGRIFIKELLQSKGLISA